jgi:hypothetical protein
MVIISDTGSITWRLVMNGTLTGATWAGTGIETASGMECDQAATAISGGQTVAFGGATSGGATDECRDVHDLMDNFEYYGRKLRRGAFDPATTDILTLCATKVNSSTTNILAGIDFKKQI